ncbi:MAG TPA: polysaccharide biosynthesis/export family protein [Longimicrobiales bacterium]
MMNVIRAALLTAAVTMTAGRAVAQDVKPDTTTAYLRVGDVVRLAIWREPDLSGDFRVPETGVVVFPKIGEWKVTDRPPDELKAALREEYRKYLRNPSIDITFLRRVNVLGAVKTPGLYPVDETMTIANVLALAGGTSPEGKPDEVQLFRDGRKMIARITQRTRISDLPLQSGDQLFVPERSWASRNMPLIATLISGAVSVAIAIIVNH